MLKPSLFIILTCLHTQLFSQQLYTKVRGGFTLETFGFAPTGMFSAEMPLFYRQRFFWNVQTGIGIVDGTISMVHPSGAVAVSFNFLLNPSQPRPCSPQPHEKRIEYYLETGAGFSISDPQHSILQRTLGTHSYTTSLGLIGIRVHVVTQKWIYIFKARATPALGNSFAPWGGVQVGLGWR